MSTFFSSLLCFAFLVSVAAVTFDDVPETLLVDVQTDISTMKKKGATDADCKDLAKTTCKEVLSEVSKAQTIINRQSTGAQCDKIGEATYTKVVTHYNNIKIAWTKARAQVDHYNDSTWKTTLTYGKLKPGKCGFIFNSKEYLAAAKGYRKAYRKFRTLTGQLSEAKKTVIRTRISRNKARFNCRCKVLKIRNATWRQVTKNRSRQQKALSKCTMMKCVLNGTPVSSNKCKAVLPKLKNKVLTRIIEWSHKNKFCQKKWQKEKALKASVKAEKRHKASEKKTKKEKAVKFWAMESRVKTNQQNKFTKASQQCTARVRRYGRKFAGWYPQRYAYQCRPRACQNAFGPKWTFSGSCMNGGGWHTSGNYCSRSCTDLFNQAKCSPRTCLLVKNPVAALHGQRSAPRYCGYSPQC
jgi:hypothetical protein